MEPVVDDVSFSLPRGKALVLIGESGSGKTTLCRSLTRLFPLDMKVSVEGSVRFEGKEILTATGSSLEQIRRNRIRYVFQGGRQALNPVSRIRSQLHLADPEGGRLSDRELCAILDEVGLRNGREVLDSYPHQLSGGMAQRVLIAMAILGSPDLLIADEPTSAVDHSRKFQIVELLRTIQHDRGLSVILVTHDLDIARSYGDNVLLLYQGQVVESAPRDDFFERPLHPYARRLIEAGREVIQPSVSNVAGEARTEGCRFYSYCPIRVDECRTTGPELEQRDHGRKVRCPCSK